MHLLLILILGMSIQQTVSLKQWLAEARWKHRVVLIYAPSAASPALQRQREEFASQASGLKERDLIVREILADQLSADDQAFLRKTLRLSDDTFQVLLIGKDGGVKARRTAPLSSEELFGLIDRMPMRKDEMRQAE